jgi:hypothetical protein
MPGIENLRISIFGKPDNPFTWDEAIEWIEKEARENALTCSKMSVGKNKESKKLRKRIECLSEKMNRIGNTICTVSYEAPFLSYPGKNGWRNAVPIFKNTRLEVINKKIKEIAEDSPFSQESLLMLLLTGMKPVPIIYKISRLIRFRGRSALTVTFNRALRYREFMRLYYEIKDFFEVKKYQLKEKHLRIYELIAENGGVPVRGKMKFWNSIFSQWNAKYPKEKFGSLNSIRISFNRIEEHIQRNVSSIEKLKNILKPQSAPMSKRSNYSQGKKGQ